MASHSKHSPTNRTNRARKTAAKPKSAPGQVRIVAGHWRGRKLPVVHADGLRPTGDRVRETLFNWLQHKVVGSRCLDLYAGSGALGLEAASRGAASVTLVESAGHVVSQLQQTLQMLNADATVQVHNGTAQTFLATEPQPFDLVFIDPPFDQQVHLDIIRRLTPECLHVGAQLYLELPTAESALLEKLPDTLELLREKRFGDVTVFLLRFTG